MLCTFHPWSLCCDALPWSLLFWIMVTPYLARDTKIKLLKACIFPPLATTVIFYMMLQTIPAITKAVTTWRMAVSSWTRNRPYQVSGKVLLDWRFFKKGKWFRRVTKEVFKYSLFLLSFASPPSPSDPCQSKGSGRRPQKSPSLINLTIWVVMNYLWEK